MKNKDQDPIECRAIREAVEEAFRQHELDVAGLEIQFENFVEWMVKTIFDQRREAKIEVLELTATVMDTASRRSGSNPFGPMMREEIDRLKKERGTKLAGGTRA